MCSECTCLQHSLKIFCVCSVHRVRVPLEMSCIIHGGWKVSAREVNSGSRPPLRPPRSTAPLTEHLDAT